MMMPWKKKKLIRKLAEAYGKEPDCEYYAGDMDWIRTYYDGCRTDNRDPFYVDEHGHVKTQSNHHGGILGGISSGMPICFDVAIKPTASIGKPQATVDYSAMTNEVLQSAEVSHPCLVPYEDLPEEEKEYDRNTSIGTLKLIMKLGFKIIH